MKKKVSLIFGARPEAIKLCPLILAMQKHPTLEPHVCVTGQHRQMLDQVLEAFGVVPEVDLALMQPNQSFGGLMQRGNLRHAPPILGLLGMVANDHDSPADLFDNRLRYESLLPLPEEILCSPSAGMKEMQQSRIIHWG